MCQGWRQCPRNRCRLGGGVCVDGEQGDGDSGVFCLLTGLGEDGRGQVMSLSGSDQNSRILSYRYHSLCTERPTGWILVGSLSCTMWTPSVQLNNVLMCDIKFWFSLCELPGFRRLLFLLTIGTLLCIHSPWLLQCHPEVVEFLQAWYLPETGDKNSLSNHIMLGPPHDHHPPRPTEPCCIGPNSPPHSLCSWGYGQISFCRVSWTTQSTSLGKTWCGPQPKTTLWC